MNNGGLVMSLSPIFSTTSFGAGVLFVAPNAGDYHLSAGSGAINAGARVLPPPLTLPDIDVDGQARVLAAAPDQGADEYGVQPFFQFGAPCGEAQMASVGVPLEFSIEAGAGSGSGGQLSLTATGVPAGAQHDPPLPLVGGASAETTFRWTPANSDVGTHEIVYSAMDSNGQSSTTTATDLTRASGTN